MPSFLLVSILCLFLFTFWFFAFVEVSSSFIYTKLNFLLCYTSRRKFFCWHRIYPNVIHTVHFSIFMWYSENDIFAQVYSLLCIEKNRMDKIFSMSCTLEYFKANGLCLVLKIVENMSTSFSKSSGRWGSALLIWSCLNCIQGPINSISY